jgi:antitoxin MazE
MIVSKMGDGLAVRLDDRVVASLGLKEGDEVEIDVKVAKPMITDPAEREAALERLRRFRGIMPADFKFNRDEANER